MSDDPVNKDLIRELAALLKETELTEIEVERDGSRIRVARSGAPVYANVPHHPPAHAPHAQLASTAAAAPGQAHPGTLASPMVGTVYLAPEPGAALFVRVGDQVAEGQTLLIVEAMKTMNPIHAPTGGRVTRILIEDGQPVEFGQPLLVIE